MTINTTTTAAFARSMGDATRADRRRMSGLDGMGRDELRALGMKRCIGCGLVKPLDTAFAAASYRLASGAPIAYRRGRCRACIRVQKAERRRQPGVREQRAAADRERLADPAVAEADREAKQRHYRRNREAILAARRTPLGKLRNNLSSARAGWRQARTDRGRERYARRIAAIEAAIARLLARQDEEMGEGE